MQTDLEKLNINWSSLFSGTFRIRQG